MKNSYALALGAIAATFTIQGAFAADFTMRISHQYPPSHQVAKALEQFAADVESGSSGKVDVQVFGSEQLFKATQNHAAVARGEVEAAAIVSFQWGGTIPEMNVTSIPYLMTSVDKLTKFAGSDASKLLDEKMASKGIRNIAWLIDANDGLFTSAKAPLITPGDFKGVKIRGLSKLLDHGLKAMGAAPSAMPGSEVYQALQTGVIDASVTGVAAGYSRRLYEVQKYGVASAFAAVYANLVVNPAWWDKLPADVQASIEAAARQAEKRLLPASDGVSQKDVANLREKGMEVVVLTPEQEKVLTDAMQEAVIKAFIDSAPDGAKLVEIVKGL
ncbi:MAG: TRAP transporter substrate-binding protein DctP [Zoogloeaceae bacterium]|nr:TRAP transporter substrate-binding protein DctP [Zoogloeaceae bacterium]